MRLRDIIHDRKAEPGPDRLWAWLEPFERLAHGQPVRRWYAGAVVRDFDPATRPVASERDDQARWRSMLDRVVDEVRDRLAQADRIAKDPDRFSGCVEFHVKRPLKRERNAFCERAPG